MVKLRPRERALSKPPRGRELHISIFSGPGKAIHSTKSGALAAGYKAAVSGSLGPGLSQPALSPPQQPSVSCFPILMTLLPHCFSLEEPSILPFIGLSWVEESSA